MDFFEEMELEQLDEFDFVWTVESLNKTLDGLKPGKRFIIDGLPNEIYHGCQGVSSSKIKYFIEECAAKYKARYIDKIIPEKDKDYFRFGNAAHTIVLEPHLFDSSYVRQPDHIGTRNGKEWDKCKAKADSKGQIVLTATQWEDMPILKKSIANTPAALKLTRGGIAERSIFIRDEETGLILKCRPDYMIKDLIVDVKTTKSANPKWVGHDFKKLGYHVQDAMYSDIANVSDFVFLAIESERPFLITAPVRMTDRAKRLGLLEYRTALRDLKQCMDSGKWPSYTDERVNVDLNKFEQEKLNNLESSFYE